MTTAHRTTWRAAIGGDNQGGNRVIIPTRQFSALDLPGHLQMKSRDDKSINEIQSKNFKEDFKNRELKYKEAKQQGFQKPTTDGKINSLLMARTYNQLQKMELQQEKQKFAKQLTQSNILQQQQPSKKKKIEDQKSLENAEDQQKQQSAAQSSQQSETPFPQDADYQYSSQQSQSEDEEKRKNFKKMLDSDDSDDDDQALMLEYQKIKKQRQQEQRRKLRLKAEQELKQKQAEILGANPAMSSAKQENHAYSLTRKWHEQTVFKNQARKQNPNKKKTFINDTVRSDFHKKFLNKYIL